jgi:hypothetical protein
VKGAGIKSVNMIKVLYIIYENRIMKPIKISKNKKRKERVENG